MALHGKMVIELKDAKTKARKQLIESDNIITNGTAAFMNDAFALAVLTNINNYYLPAYDKLFKGCLLFSDELEEDPDNYGMPSNADAALTGHAGDATSDGNLNTRGDFNPLESGPITNGYKFVWDFGTNDANGRIACVALTNKVAGFNGNIVDVYKAGNGSQSGTGSNPSTYRGFAIPLRKQIGEVKRSLTIPKPTKIETVDDGVILTYVSYTSGTTVSVKKYKITANKIALNNSLWVEELIEDRTITISADDVSINAYSIICDGGDGYTYFFYWVAATDGLTTKMAKLNMSTYVYTPAISGSAILQGYYRPATNSIYQAVVRNNKLYCWVRDVLHSNNMYMLCEIDTASLSDAHTIDTTEQEISRTGSYLTDHDLYWIYKAPNDDIYTPRYILDKSGYVVNKDFYGAESEGDIGRVRTITNKEYVYLFYHENRSGDYCYEMLYKNPWYLATINNLPTPVTKTSALTMKITYTLTYA